MYKNIILWLAVEADDAYSAAAQLTFAALFFWIIGTLCIIVMDFLASRQ